MTSGIKQGSVAVTRLYVMLMMLQYVDGMRTYVALEERMTGRSAVSRTISRAMILSAACQLF